MTLQECPCVLHIRPVSAGRILDEDVQQGVDDVLRHLGASIAVTDPEHPAGISRLLRDRNPLLQRCNQRITLGGIVDRQLQVSLRHQPLQVRPAQQRLLQHRKPVRRRRIDRQTLQQRRQVPRPCRRKAENCSCNGWVSG